MEGRLIEVEIEIDEDEYKLASAMARQSGITVEEQVRILLLEGARIENLKASSL